MDGAHIRAASGWVRAGAEGTNIVFEAVDYNTLRVYLLADNNPGASIDLTCDHGTHESSFLLKEEGKYVTIDQETCTISEPKSISTDAGVADFIGKVTKINPGPDPVLRP